MNKSFKINVIICFCLAVISIIVFLIVNLLARKVLSDTYTYITVPQARYISWKEIKNPPKDLKDAYGIWFDDVLEDKLTEQLSDYMKEKNLYISSGIYYISDAKDLNDLKTLLNFASKTKDFIFIEIDDFYFGMSNNDLIKMIGEPQDKNLNAYDASIDEYIYSTVVEQHNATYNFYFLKSELIEMCLTIEDIDYDFALSIVEDCMNKQKNYYSENDDYYSNEIETIGDTYFSVSNGVDNGATGISFDYEYSQGTLTLSAIKQE